VKEEISFVFKQIYFPYYSVCHPGHMYDAKCMHTHHERWQQ